MRFSQGASYGRYGELYHPEVFNDREEVIVFKREEFASALNYDGTVLNLLRI